MSEIPGQPIPLPNDTPVEKILVLLSTGLGVGKVHVAPGTFGSLWGPLLALGLQSINADWSFMLLSGVILFTIGIPICDAGIRHYQTGDPKHVVYDEIAAFAFVFLLVPVTIGTAVAGFVLFRIFDISKLWPVRRFEALPGPWGVMADDTVAGIIAGAILTAIWFSLGLF